MSRIHTNHPSAPRVYSVIGPGRREGPRQDIVILPALWMGDSVEISDVCALQSKVCYCASTRWSYCLQRCPACTVSQDELWKVFPADETPPLRFNPNFPDPGLYSNSAEIPPSDHFGFTGAQRLIPGVVPLGDLGGGAPLEDMHIEPGEAAVEIEVGEPLEFQAAEPGLLVDEDAQDVDEGYEDEPDDEDAAADEPQEALAPAPPGEGLDCALVAAGFDAFQMVTVCDRLHALDLGLTKFLFTLLSVSSHDYNSINHGTEVCQPATTKGSRGLNSAFPGAPTLARSPSEAH
jgi:hypothetical protein